MTNFAEQKKLNTLDYRAYIRNMVSAGGESVLADIWFHVAHKPLSQPASRR